MAEDLEHLNNPWLVPVWPGMGSVAMLAGSQIVSSLSVDVTKELQADEFFEIHHVEVSDGLAVAGRRPKNVFLLWRDPKQQRDLIIFMAESQPQHGGYRLCRQIAQFARDWNVKRIVTFAAMATQLHPSQEASVFVVANNAALIDESRARGLRLLAHGQVSGMNGLMLAAAAEVGIPGLCLMGEMPYFAVNVPSPPAALAALRAFTDLADVQLDLSRLEVQARQVRRQLEELVERLQASSEEDEESALGFTTPDLDWQSQEDEHEPAEQRPRSELDPQAEQRIESLFEQVKQDRSKAMRLKHELDRLNVFGQYEDRFLDLFRKGG